MAQIRLTRKESFSAAHHYRLPWMGEDEAERIYGPLTVHGHDYVLFATITGEVDERTGMVENLKSIKKAIREEVLAELHNRFLNEDIPFFREAAPTLENLSGYIWGRLENLFSSGSLERLELRETDAIHVERIAGSEEMNLTRAYHFCAAHRLHAADLGDDENRELFGKCNNPRGHGHNYELEITVAGELDDNTGTIANIGEMDRVVDDRVLEYLDHKHLNVDIEEFRELNPTAENIVRVIWERLGPDLGGARLYRVRLWETPRNMAEYFGD